MFVLYFIFDLLHFLFRPRRGQ